MKRNGIKLKLVIEYDTTVKKKHTSIASPRSKELGINKLLMAIWWRKLNKPESVYTYQGNQYSKPD